MLTTRYGEESESVVKKVGEQSLALLLPDLRAVEILGRSHRPEPVPRYRLTGKLGQKEARQ